MYNKKEWKSNELITKEALNNIENGIDEIDKTIYHIEIPNDINSPYLMREFIQNEINYAYENKYNKVKFPKQQIIEMIDECNGVAVDNTNKKYMPNMLNLKSNTEYDLNGCTLKISPNNYSGYRIVNCVLLKNTILKNGAIEGDKLEHDYSTIESSHEWGYGVYIGSCKMCSIQHIEIKNLTGDGSYMGGILSYYSTNTSQSSTELGSIDFETGENIDGDTTYRLKDYIKLDDLLNEDDINNGLSKNNKLFLFPGNGHGY